MASGSKKVAVSAMSSPEIPFPELKLGYDEAAFNLVIPVSKSDQPADFALLTRLVGFTISDEIWGMVDPTGALPHDPATVIVDTKGKATLTADLMDTAEMEAAGDATARPAERAGSDRAERLRRGRRADRRGRFHLRQHRHDHLRRHACPHRQARPETDRRECPARQDRGHGL